MKHLCDEREAKGAVCGHPSGSYTFAQTRTGPDDREQHVVAIRDLTAKPHP